MRKRAILPVTAGVLPLLLMLGLPAPASASASASADGAATSPATGTCIGQIHYTFDPPLRATPRQTNTSWSGDYSCSTLPLIKTRTWHGTFKGSVKSVTGCLQASPDQVLTPSITETDHWSASKGGHPADESTLTGTVSTLPREDGTRVAEWTGTVTGGTWFVGHHFNGNNIYSSLADGKLCLAGGEIGHNDGTAVVTFLPL
ncbi:hypothetical protein AB0L26_20415 [Streptomyces nondiastaticus]|uniref:hypothetical protein n=1 Tax=Streptomyces nondiastaticus TaxID=3154512 RepID=UPI00343E4929